MSATAFILRRLRPEDARALWEAARASAREIQPWMASCTPDLTLGTIREWIAFEEEQWTLGQRHAFAIAARAGGAPVGAAGLNQINARDRLANAFYWVTTAHAGCGAASCALRELARFAFDALALQRVEVVMSTANAASRRAAEKAGARCEGRLRNRLWLHGRAHDAWMFSLVPEDLGKASGHEAG